MRTQDRIALETEDRRDEREALTCRYQQTHAVEQHLNALPMICVGWNLTDLHDIHAIFVTASEYRAAGAERKARAQRDRFLRQTSHASGVGRRMRTLTHRRLVMMRTSKLVWYHRRVHEHKGICEGEQEK